MWNDPNNLSVAIRHANARVAVLREKVACEVADLSQQRGLTPEHDRLDMPLMLYGIKQVSIDPQGFLRLLLQADEEETMTAARLYEAIHEGFDWAVSELIDISEELFNHKPWRQFTAAELEAMQARDPENAGTVLPALLLRAYAHSYVCGEFAAEYPEHLLRLFPTMARIYDDVLDGIDLDSSAKVVAMQMALIDLLMVPNEAGWHEQVNRD